MRNGAIKVYLIISAMGSANKFGMISSQWAGTEAALADWTSYKDTKWQSSGHFTKNRKYSDNKLNSGTEISEEKQFSNGIFEWKWIALMQLNRCKLCYYLDILALVCIVEHFSSTMNRPVE